MYHKKVIYYLPYEMVNGILPFGLFPLKSFLIVSSISFLRTLSFAASKAALC